jgi:hypothetical protein
LSSTKAFPDDGSLDRCSLGSTEHRNRRQQNIEDHIYDPEAKLVYVASGDAKTATLIDPVVPAVAGIVRLPGIPEYPAVDSHTGLVY